MGKKFLKSLLIVMLLSGVSYSAEENDSPSEHKEEYITITVQQLEEYKNRINQNLEIMENTEKRLIFLEQQNAEIKQQNIEVNQKLEQTNAFLEKLLQKFK